VYLIAQNDNCFQYIRKIPEKGASSIGSETAAATGILG
jgi:hypothetical protein